MELKKVKETESPLVGRKSIVFTASFTGEATPSGENIQKVIAEKLKISPELVEIDSIIQDYGSASATVEAHIYNDEKSMKRFRGLQPKNKKNG